MVIVEQFQTRKRLQVLTIVSLLVSFGLGLTDAAWYFRGGVDQAALSVEIEPSV